MGCRLPFKDFPIDALERIKKELCLRPKAGFFMVDSFGVPLEKDSIHFYLTTPEALIVPFHYGRKRCRLPNPYWEDSQLNFIGELRPVQQEVMTEVATHLRTHQSANLNLHTGFGKTICGAFLACRSKYLTCVIVQRSFLLDQWVNTFEKVTTNRGIWIVQKGKPPPETFDVILCMNRRIKHIPEEIKVKIGLVILDEAHLLCIKSTSLDILTLQPRYLITLTATPERQDGMEAMIELMAGSHCVTKKFSNPFVVRKVLTGLEFPTERTRGKLDFSKLQSLVAASDSRNELILQRINHNRDRKILVLVALVEHAKTLKTKIETELGMTADTFCGGQKGYQDGDVLVGTTSKIGVGFDQLSCPTFDGRRFDLIILGCSFKDTNRLAQNVGRGLRSDFPIVEHFVDANAIFNRHWKGCEKWYRQHNAVIEVIGF